MAVLNAEEIKRLKKREALGYVFAAVSAAAFVYFAVCFAAAQIMDLPALRLSTLICAPIIAAVSAAVSAYCNLKYGGKTEKLVEEYVRAVFLENASLMHPEKEILNFAFNFTQDKIILKVNKFKEEIIFDFSAFGKLSAFTRPTVSAAVANRLSHTFCLLAERGAKYKTVSYTACDGVKEGKPVYIILNGIPDKKAYRAYLKTK
ncbi:MAG: hypothetical protein K2L42_05080 [Clostridia bacterium]|nr:hypothetical protein [Clostridia bacterium]